MLPNPNDLPPGGHEAERIHTTKIKRKPGTPPNEPPPEPDIFYDDNPSRLWHFTHSREDLPVALSVVVNARTEAAARGAAYLLSEDFCQRVIGQINAE